MRGRIRRDDRALVAVVESETFTFDLEILDDIPEAPMSKFLDFTLAAVRPIPEHLVSELAS